MRDYVITIKKGRKARIENGRVKRFGRSEYLSRRGTPQETVAPYFISFNSAALQPGGSRTQDFVYGEQYWLRPDDIMMVFTYGLESVTLTNGFSTLVLGRCSVFWKRWKAGDPTEVTVTMADTEAYSLTTVRFVVLRNAQTTGNPFTFTTASGSGATATFPSIDATTDDLVLTTHHATGLYDGVGDYPSGQFTRLWGFFADSIPNTSTWKSGKISAGILAESGNLQPLEAVTYADSWSTLTMAVKPSKPLKRVLSGPHVGSPSFFYQYQRPPFLLPGDIVVTYVVSASSTIQVPDGAGSGWEPVAGTPVQSGPYWLHVYWNRVPEDSYPDLYRIAYPGVSFLRLNSIVRGGPKSGDPFGSFAVTAGAGTSVSGTAVPTQKNQLVVNTAVAKFSPTSYYSMGSLISSGVSEFEINNDSSWVVFNDFQYKTASGYSTGSSAGAFTASIDRSAASLWAVTFTVKK